MTPGDGIIPNRSAPLALHLGDEVQLKKPHPCGGDRWRILRVGADIRLQCVTCGRMIMVPRAHIERRVRRLYPVTPLPPPGLRPEE